MPLPVEMDLNIRLMIRGLHIGLFYKLRETTRLSRPDFNELMSRGSPEAHKWGVAGAVSMIIVGGLAGIIRCRPGAWLRRLLLTPGTRSRNGAVVGGRIKAGTADTRTRATNFRSTLLIWMLVGELKHRGPRAGLARHARCHASRSPESRHEA